MKKTLILLIGLIAVFDLNDNLAQGEMLEIEKNWIIQADFSPIKKVFWENFNLLDKEKKGFLVRSDFYYSFLTWLGGLRYFGEIDLDSDGRLDKKEMEIFSLKEEISKKNHFIKRWQEHDLNKDGFLSIEEFNGVNELNENFSLIDLNKDNLISPNEFIISLARSYQLK